MGFISKFILPQAVDFDAALQAQSQATRGIVAILHYACTENDMAALTSIVTDAEQAQALKTKNMKVLLDVFITPYDKEAIYRIITQLDWIVLSVKHFRLETEAYNIESLQDYRHIFQELNEMAILLDAGITQISFKQIKTLAVKIDLVHDKYDLVVELCAQTTAKLLQQDNIKHIFIHKDLLAQLKEIAKRIHIAANTLEDMAIKIV